MIQQDLELVRGDYQQVSVEARQPGVGAYDLTGVSKVWFTIKRLPTDADPGFIQKTLVSGITVVSAVAGTMTITLEATDSTSVTSTEPPMVYDCQILDASSKPRTVAIGKVFWVVDITQATS